MNIKNPAIKRILADVRELQRHPSSRYFAVPLEENLFEWHFTIRGPTGSDFEGGIYHGRILLSPDYPFKPPNIVFITKNGRFETGTKICLSISAYHEESWQPAWGVRTMLEAIISFMPSEGAGAIGALDWSKVERQKLAKESVNCSCTVCGPIASLLTEPTDTETDAPAEDILAQINQMKFEGKTAQSDGELKPAADSPVNASFSEPLPTPSSSETQSEQCKSPTATEAETTQAQSSSGLHQRRSESVSAASPVSSTPIAPVATPRVAPAAALPNAPRALVESDPVDQALFATLVLLSSFIFYLVYRQMDLVFGNGL